MSLSVGCVHFGCVVFPVGVLVRSLCFVPRTG